MPTYSRNKKAYADYHILETKEAGIVLSGAEVKSIRNGQINLKGSYITIANNAAYIINAHISPYAFAKNQQTYHPTAPRTLLLHKKEIAYLQGKSAEKGLTIVPLSLYTKGRHIKVELGIVKGKKQYDKKQDIKKRDIERDMRRQGKYA